jgi:hypothetical protein
MEQFTLEIYIQREYTLMVKGKANPVTGREGP